MSSCYDSTSRLISPKNMTFDTVMVKKKKKKDMAIYATIEELFSPPHCSF